jgi:uncharacterized protein (TIGR02391 family)
VNPAFARRVLAACSAAHTEIVQSGFGAVAEATEPLALFDRIITHPRIRRTARRLYRDGYYALAVEESFKLINEAVKERSSLRDDGAGLMRSAFGPKNPVLALNDLRTESEVNEQLGYMDILAGCMTGIRNPRAHKAEYLDAPDRALEMIAWAQHLMLIIDRSRPTQGRSRK